MVITAPPRTLQPARPPTSRGGSRASTGRTSRRDPASRSTRPTGRLGSRQTGERATARHRAERRWTGTALVVLMVLVVLTQRFVVPLGTPVSVALPLLYITVVVMLIGGHLRLDRMRSELFAAVAGLVLFTTAASGATGGLVSVTSVGLLLVLWAPWVLRLRPGHLDVQQRVAKAFVNLMVVMALVGVGQVLVQFAGLWEFTDYPKEWFPQLLEDGYNTSDPIAFDSPVWKASAFLFLEPSFFSQYCALGAVVALVMRQSAWKVLALVLGMASSLAGTGIILLAVGVLLTAVRMPRALRPSVVFAGLVAIAAVVLSPIFPLLAERSGETSQAGTSGYLRFVQPYTEAASGLEAEPVRYLFGAGPGSAQRLLESGLGGTQGDAVLYSIIPKALFEYGVVAGGVVILFIVLAVLDRPAWIVVPGTVLVFLFFLNGNLLNPQNVVTAWLLTSIFAGQRPTGTPARPAPRARIIR